MPKRARPKPLDDGILKSIYDWFFRPIVINHSDPESNDIQAFMEMLFDVDKRHLSQWSVVKSFVMPGLCYVNGTQKIQGVGKSRRLQRRTLLMMREDDRKSGSVDVEFFGGRNQKEQVFCLTREEWDWVKLHIKPEAFDPNKPKRKIRGSDASKPGYRNKLRRPKLRRVEEKTGCEGQGEEGAV